MLNQQGSNWTLSFKKWIQIASLIKLYRSHLFLLKL
ncbi:unnamed protein product [Brugia pahangi]|uniref:Uncharacterized protein n=1 Tax=Brugia pahangi TaxID=6280 RepID=A0A0N4T2I8_BRUPA|nr:unnamed protein product [Brugia pahangi]